MSRIVMLAAAAALLALPASAQSLRISTVGKSPEQLHADIVTAAKKVCRKANIGVAFEDAARQVCTEAAIKDGVAQARSPQLTRISAMTSLAQR